MAGSATIILAPTPRGTLHLAPDNGMRFRGIGADDEQCVVESHFADGIRHCSAAERYGQTGHGGSVSGAGTMVEIVGAHHRPHEFLHYPVFFVGTAGRTQGGEKASLPSRSFLSP